MQIPEPHASQHKKSHGAFLSLFDRIGMSRANLARHTGICERRVRYLHAGFKEIGGVRTAVLMTYPEQVTLELLAELAEASARRNA